MKVILAQLSAIVASGDGPHAAAGRGANAAGHRGADDLLARAVNDNLVGAVGLLVQLALDAAAQCRAKHIRRRSHQALVPRTNLAAATRAAARERRNDARLLPDRFRRPPYGRQARRLID